MSAKQEQAQAPATVSHADTGPAPQHPHPLQHQPHPPNYHQGQVIYQQPYTQVNHFQPQGTVWNQPPQATVHYMQYAPAPQPEAVNFQENKVQSYNHYGTVHFAQPQPQPMDNGDMMMRNQQQQFVPQQYVQSPQWYPQGQQGPTQFIPSYAQTFNVANDPTYHPNHPMNRPGAGRDDYQDSSSGYMQFVSFVAPIGAMESQAHASASYTANWVSSTSSLPPEMKDEPESDNISQYDSQRPTSQMNGDNWTDQEDHLSPSTTQQSFTLPQQRQMPYVEKDKSASQSTTKTSKSAKGERDGKRELTFDERLEKARMQKSRVENEGGNGEANPNMAQGSNQMMLPMEHMPRYGQQNYSYARQQGYNNNTHNHNSGNNFYYNGNQNTQEGYFTGEPQFQPPHFQHQPRYPRGNATNARTERDRNFKRDNNYSNNRFENNQHNNSYNQRPQQNQNSNQGPSEYQRQPSYRGRGGRGGFRGGFLQQAPPSMNNPIPVPYNGPPMNPQMIAATMNVFQNTHIGPVPPGMQRLPLLPGPFGIPRRVQDVKFHNTWLDASSCPMPLGAVMNIDTRFGTEGLIIPFRGRGRGNFGFRGGYRGGFGNGRYIGKPPDAPASAEPASFQEADKEIDEQEENKVDEENKDTETTNSEVPADKPAEEETSKPEST